MGEREGAGLIICRVAGDLIHHPASWMGVSHAKQDSRSSPVAERPDFTFHPLLRGENHVQYQTKTWSGGPGKMLNVSIRGPRAG